MSNIVIGTLNVDARKGVRTDAAVRDALILALQENRKVRLTFNGCIGEIDPEAIVTRLCSEMYDPATVGKL